MNKILLAGVAALALTVSTNAFAAGEQAQAGASATTAYDTNAAAVQGQKQGQQQGVIYAPQDNSRSKVENDPPAIAPNLGGLVATPTTCMGSTQGSVGAVGVVSLGFGTTWKDHECEAREALKLAAQLGLKEAAAALFYNLDAVQEVMDAPGATRAIGEAENVANYNVRADMAARQAEEPVEDKGVRGASVQTTLTIGELRWDQDGDGRLSVMERNQMRDN